LFLHEKYDYFPPSGGFAPQESHRPVKPVQPVRSVSRHGAQGDDARLGEPRDEVARLAHPAADDRRRQQLGIGIALELTNDLDGAVDAYSRVVELNPKDADG
jgi:hypothetical protein